MGANTRSNRAVVDHMDVQAFTVPTDQPESDGTLEWDSTTCVVVRAWHGDTVGLGYTYSHACVAELIDSVFAGRIVGSDVMDPERAWRWMLDSVRNLGRQGLAAHAISAVDVALWDLKARLLSVSLSELWGRVRTRVSAYGSGGFTSYDQERLEAQIEFWRSHGARQAKIKVGRKPDDDLARVRAAQRGLGPGIELFVDANGAYDRGQAEGFARQFGELGVTWLEEPLSSDDLEGMAQVRASAPGGLRIAAGEYGYHPMDLRRLLDASAVDVVQVDVTRCLGFTGTRKAAALCESYGVPLSTHCAPALSAHVGTGLARLLHIEAFHDHMRLEPLLFDGVPEWTDGTMQPDVERPGHGMSLRPDADRYAV